MHVISKTFLRSIFLFLRDFLYMTFIEVNP